DRPGALKVLPVHFISDQARLRRFHTEARAASALNHPNILTIYEVGQDDDVSFIAAEYIDGATIRERIRYGDLSIGEVLQIADQLLCGLTAAHAAGIVHRDIKPENVMQRRDGVVKILDFGIAKLLEPAPEAAAPGTETSAGLMLGTIGYMSPEQVRGLMIDERSDIWSCSVVLYEMLTRRRPFGGKTNADTLAAILEHEPAPIFEVDSRGPRALRQFQMVVDKALRKEPDERYQTAAEMRADLERIRTELERHAAISDQTSVSELPRLAAQTTGSAIRRETIMLIVAGLLTLVLLGVFIFQRQRSRTRANSLPAPAVGSKSYARMSEAEKLNFVAAQEQRISAMMGERPVKLNHEALRAIKAHAERKVRRQDSASLKPGEESLRVVYARAPEYIPTIARAFAERKIPIIIGVYLPMIESEYKPCYENEIGA